MLSEMPWTSFSWQSEDHQSTKDGDIFDGGERAVSRLVETDLNQRAFEQVSHSQDINPLRQVGNIMGCALLLDNPENIIPLACRGAPSHQTATDPHTRSQ